MGTKNVGVSCYVFVELKPRRPLPLLSSPLPDFKQSVGSQPWIFIGRTDAEAEALVFWAPDGKSRLIGKDPDAGKDQRQKEKGMTEDEMIR